MAVVMEPAFIKPEMTRTHHQGFGLKESLGTGNIQGKLEKLTIKTQASVEECSYRSRKLSTTFNSVARQQADRNEIILEEDLDSDGELTAAAILSSQHRTEDYLEMDEDHFGL